MSITNKQEPDYLAVEDNAYWRSYDLGCCAALISVGYKLVALDRVNPQRVQFIVERNDSLDQVVEAYWSGQLQVSAREYFDTLRMLKTRLHSDEGGPR